MSSLQLRSNNMEENDAGTRGSRVDLSTTEGIEKLSKRIRIAYTRLTGRTGEADDCVQGVLLRMLEGKNQHSTINQAVIDYLRTESGRKGSPGYTARLNLLNANSFESNRTEPKTECDYGGGIDSGRISFSLGENPGSIRSQVVLLAHHGWTLKEIGEHFGFSESRACQLHKEGLDRLRILSFLPSFVRDWAVKYVL